MKHEYVKDEGCKMNETTGIFFRDDAWWAVWRNQSAGIAFNSRGAAIAYLQTCTRAGRLRK